MCTKFRSFNALIYECNLCTLGPDEIDCLRKNQPFGDEYLRNIFKHPSMGGDKGLRPLVLLPSRKNTLNTQTSSSIAVIARGTTGLHCKVSLATASTKDSDGPS